MCESFFYTETCRFICSWHISLISSWHFQSQTVVWKYIVWEWTSSLLGFVNRRINREWQRFSLRNMQRKKGSKRIEIITKMVDEFILHTQTRCSSLYARGLTAGQKKLWKIRTGPPGHQAIAGCWLWAARLSWATGLWLSAGLPAFSKMQNSVGILSSLILMSVLGRVLIYGNWSIPSLLWQLVQKRGISHK